MLTTRGTVRLRFIVSIMLIMAGVLLLIGVLVPLLFTGFPKPMPIWYIALTVLLFGAAAYWGPRVRLNLASRYPQQARRYERFEKWALWGVLIYFGLHLISD